LPAERNKREGTSEKGDGTRKALSLFSGVTLAEFL